MSNHEKIVTLVCGRLENAFACQPETTDVHDRYEMLFNIGIQVLDGMEKSPDQAELILHGYLAGFRFAHGINQDDVS